MRKFTFIEGVISLVIIIALVCVGVAVAKDETESKWAGSQVIYGYDGSDIQQVKVSSDGRIYDFVTGEMVDLAAGINWVAESWSYTSSAMDCSGYNAVRFYLEEVADGGTWNVTVTSSDTSGGAYLSHGDTIENSALTGLTDSTFYVVEDVGEYIKASIEASVEAGNVTLKGQPVNR